MCGFVSFHQISADEKNTAVDSLFNIQQPTETGSGCRSGTYLLSFLSLIVLFRSSVSIVLLEVNWALLLLCIESVDGHTGKDTVTCFEMFYYYYYAELQRLESFSQGQCRDSEKPMPFQSSSAFIF